MHNIIYRNYKKGDDAQLAYLYMKAFQENSISYIRTAKIERWRYFKSPDFEPEMIQIAEDVDNNMIVGAVFVNLIETLLIDDKSYVVGDINDVSCHPDYTQQGIATKLMENAINYMEQKKCDISILTADYYGIARKKLYLRFGFKDVTHLNAYVNFCHYFRLIRDVPLLLWLTPLIFSLSYLSRAFFRFKIHKNSYFKNFSSHIVHNSHHKKFAELFNKIIPNYYEGYSNYYKEKVNWARKNVPHSQEQPTYVLIRNKKRIIGVASLTFERLYITPLKKTVRIGLIHEFAIEKETFPSKEYLQMGIAYLIDKVMKAAILRNIGVLLYEGDSRDEDIKKGFQLLNFRIINSGVLMMKQFNNVDIRQNKTPWFVPTYVSLGFP
ncbi:MAG: GNAT family N-acetyltransferase [Promethearchaeota archaeon]|nr:MAG: GNAT family N-acetyltransferase [Candidatus Lokiarchaeota archaeon]